MLKQLIQRLLDSRTTPAQAGHASKPGSAVPVDYNPSASVDNWGPVLSNSTAVSDGYIWATGHTTSDKGFFQIKTQALQITTTILSLPPTALSRLFCAKILKGSALVLSRKGEATAKNAQELMRQTYLDGTRHSSLFKKASESNFHPRFSAPLQDVSFCLTKPNLTVGGASC